MLPLGSDTKGQSVRLVLSSDNVATPDAVIAAAKQLTLHVSVQFENSTTKDTIGDWVINEPVGISYDITSNALVKSDETILSLIGGKSIEDMQNIWGSGPVKFKISNVHGVNNRTVVSDIVRGSVVVTSLVINAPNRQTATYTTTLQGYGIYEVTA